MKPKCYTCQEKPGKPYFCSLKCAAVYANFLFACSAGEEGPQYCATCQEWLTGVDALIDHEDKGHNIQEVIRPPETY